MIFITIPLGCPSRMCLIKTFTRKNPLEKILVKEKEYNISINGKRVQNIIISPPHENSYI
jgi:hypothetical protein